MKTRSKCCFAAAACFFALTAVLRANLFVYLSAENGASVNTSTNNYVENGTNYAIIFKPTPPASWTPYPWVDSTRAYNGTHSIGMEILPQNPTSSSDVDKVNIRYGYGGDSFALTNGITRYTGFAVMWPSATNPTPTARYLFTQWWQGSPYHPPIAFEIIPNTNPLQWHAVLYNNDTGGNPSATAITITPANNTLSFDTWHTFVAEVKPDYYGYTGILKVWVDGAVVIDQSALRIGYDPTTDPYCGPSCSGGSGSNPNANFDEFIGPYRNRQNTEQQLFFDEVRFADTYSEAVPQSSLPQAAAPTFNPVGGNYDNNQSVTISSSTPGAAINYTTDGNTPSATSGSVYFGPVAIDASATLQAIAYASGYTPSPVTTELYSLVAAPVTFSPVAGTYTSAQNVALAIATQGATVYYTTNGATPTTSSTVYNSPIPVSSGTVTIKAIGTESGFTNSAVASAAYTISTPSPAAPVFSPAPGTYATAQSVTINDSTAGATIYFTTDGSTPTTTSAAYSGPIDIAATTTLKAVAVVGNASSSVTSGVYTISQAASTEINDTASGIVYTGTWNYSSNRGLGDYQNDVHDTKTDGDSMSYTFTGTGIAYVTEKDSDEGDVAVYIDNVLQTTVSCTNSTRLAQQIVYSNAGLTSGSHTLKLVKSSGTYMLVDALIIYTSSQPTVATPTFSPAAGTYASAQNVSISNATSGATIRYTTDDSTPTETVGTVYSGAVSLGSSATLKAIAYKSGYLDSSVASAAYMIGAPSCVTATAGGSWQDAAISPAQSGTFTATFQATPSASPTNAVIALSNGAQTAFSNFACLVRFNPSGDIDARNGGSYVGPSTPIPYSAGAAYNFRVVVNVPSQTYSIYVTPPGGTELTVGTNFAFRASDSSLNYWGAFVDSSSGGSGTLTVCGLTP